jgi:tRNA (guanosine-2'-O-)-methyltransferase
MEPDLNNYLKQFINPNRLKLINEKLNLRTRYITIVLEDLFQPHNASAVMRTCDCFGIQDIHIIENKNKFLGSDEIALGSDQWLTLSRYNKTNSNTIETLSVLKNNGYRIVATSSHHNATPIEEFNLEKQKTAFVFGTELNGITDDVKNMADEFAIIPMFGFTESLNISVAAAIILHYTSYKLRKSNIDWQLSDEEKKVLEVQWLKNSIQRPDKIVKHFENHIKLNPNRL